MANQKLHPEIVAAAIEGFEAQKRRIDEQISELRQMLKGAPSETPSERGPRKRTISAAGKRAIAEAQRKRWAATKKQSGPATTKAAPAKRKLSAAGRKKIAEATKKRWAAFRAQKATAGKQS